MTKLPLVIGLLALLAPSAVMGETWTVEPSQVGDRKAVFATVESANVVPARARIGGTIATLEVQRGDSVSAGQVIATVVDDKLALQLEALDAQISGLRAQFDQATINASRIERLAASKTVSQARLDDARTALNVAETSLNAQIAQRSVVAQQVVEGAVRAPAAGRVLDVPVTPGTTVMPGEMIAEIADRSYMLRLRVPERHALFLRPGDIVSVAGSDLGAGVAAEGVVTLVYPRIEEGRVLADATLDGLSDYFVGQRVRVWVSAGEREAILIPADFVETRFGTDYVSLETATGALDIPVQRGRLSDDGGQVEILSGLHAGDVLVQN